MNKFVVINFKKLIITLAIASILIGICVAGNSLVENVIEVASSKLLPIYSVETNEKVVALTFDCAWRC